MKIVVCLKEVPDTASRIELSADAKSVQQANLKFVINPYDEFALEEALRVKDADPTAEVVVLCIGPERAAESLRKALAMGADRAVHVKLENLPFGESLVIAKMLQQLVNKEKPDVVLMGKQAVDDDLSQVGPMLAGLLDWPQVLNVSEVKIGAKEIEATREVEGGASEMWRVGTPTLIAMTKGVHEPRYASLKGIMAAKKKEIQATTPAELGVDPASAAHFELEKLSLPPERGAVKMISGDPATQAAELVRLLREEAKVI